MRRLHVVVAALLVGGVSLVGLGGTAVADTDRPASFCGTAENLANEFEDFDPEDFTDAETFEAAEKLYKRLAREAPSSLKGSFKKITKLYKTLSNAGGDLTDPAASQALISQSTKAAKALNKVFKYLSSKCDLDLG